MGYTWQPDIDYAANRSIKFWRAQLAFRGFSPRGSNLDALKERLRRTEMREMDHLVAAGKHKMKAAWKLQVDSPTPLEEFAEVDNEDMDDEEEEDEEEEDKEEEEDENEADDSLEEEDDEDDNPGPWDITGCWEIRCRALLYWSNSPLTIEIGTREQRLGHQTYGSFDFGSWNGVLRFTAEGGYGPEEFILSDSDLPSKETPTCYYRWRGIEVGEDVIQLGSDNDLYSLTFSKNGKYMQGTWGCLNGEPGTVNFIGVKVGNAYNEMDIHGEWKSRNEAAYDKANRDRWKRY